MNLTDKITYTLEDNMDLMARYPDGFFNLAIVDPPYFENVDSIITPGAETSNLTKRKRFEKIDWVPPGAEYFNELFRVSKHQIIWGCNYYAEHIPAVGRIVWDKKNDKSVFSKAEIASNSLKNSVSMFRYRWNGMLQENMKDKEVRIHPTQKPVALYEWLLKEFANEGDRILDTYMGSGSHLIAADRLGFELVACEKDPTHYENSISRFSDITAQTRLLL